MPLSFYFDLVVVSLSAATVAVIFWSLHLQRKLHQAQQATNAAQMQINLVHHARLSNLERHVLAEEMNIEVQPTALN